MLSRYPFHASVDAWLYKPKKGKYRHMTAVHCIKPWPGKYKPRQK